MATRERPRFIAALLGATWVLNLADAAATLHVVSAGYATEANPFMGALLELGPLPFAVTKVALVSAGLSILWRFAARELAQLGSVLVCTAYAMVALLHLGWLHALTR